MGVYLKQFENNTWYENYINGIDAVLPNVSLCVQENEVHYNPYVQETRLVTKYNVTSTSEPTALRTNYEQNIFKSMEIDGVMLDELVTEYTFDTTGEHTVKYELYDETKLGNQAPVFYNSNLIKCVIPNSVNTIGNNVFMNCSSITSITIPDSVTIIGTAVFVSCASLTSIDIPDGVTNISEGTFNNCTGLTSIDIPNSVTNIDISAFSSCTSLTNVIIGNGVTSICQNAFKNCSSLSSVTINTIEPPVLGTDVFTNINDNYKIYVPSVSVDTYKSSNFWYNYIDRIQAIS